MPIQSARLLPVRDGVTITGPDEGLGIGTAPTVDGALDGAAAPPNAAANDRRSSSISGAVHGSSKSARPVSGYARFNSLLVCKPSSLSATLFIVGTSSSNPPCVIEREAWPPS